jgi:hypothetical protein
MARGVQSGRRGRVSGGTIMAIDLEAKTTRRGPSGAKIHALTPASRADSEERRPWTIKGVRADTVSQSRKAAQTQGMLLSLWVEKQLRDAAERELNGAAGKKLAAELMCEKIENIESVLRQYLKEQDKRISQLQDDLRTLNNRILPPLLALASDRRKKTA